MKTDNYPPSRLIANYFEKGYTEKMKYDYRAVFIVLFIMAVLTGCGRDSGTPAGEVNFDRDASYALGMNIGAGLRDSMDADGIVPNFDEFMQGLKDGLTRGNTRFGAFEAVEKIDTAFNALTEGRNADAAQREIDFLTENSRNPGVQITSSGLQYEILVPADGPKPSAADTVQVHYTGSFTDGSVFDSSLDRGVPVEFALDEVITGWGEGLQLMSIGSKYKFYIPSEYGYGPGGRGPIPPYSTLIFEVELLDILN